MLIDSHCHLDFPSLAEDLDGVLRRAADAGVGRMVTICTKLSAFAPVRAIAEAHPQIYCSVGIHPHDAAREAAASVEDLLAEALHPKVVGIGESGLDFYYEHSPREVQARQFRTHIRAARESGLPLIVHSRDADAEMASILAEEMAAGPFTGVMHCFSSGPALAEAALDLGLYLSLSGILTFKNAEELREIARQAPLDRLLVETDAPYLAPVPMRGRTNEPAYVAHTAAKLAELKGVGIAEIERRTTDNFERLFAKAVP